MQQFEACKIRFIWAKYGVYYDHTKPLQCRNGTSLVWQTCQLVRQPCNCWIYSWNIFVTNSLEYRDAFALFDKRGDGKIDSDQIGDVLRALNLNPTEADVKKIVNEVDPNGEWYFVYLMKNLVPNTPHSIQSSIVC